MSGQAVYTRDVQHPGTLYAQILLSPYASARIKSIDTSKAAALIGLRDILRYDDPDVGAVSEEGLDGRKAKSDAD
jgi:xanthine dehydrogenase molybdenum-binding subunit